LIKGMRGISTFFIHAFASAVFYCLMRN